MGYLIKLTFLFYFFIINFKEENGPFIYKVFNIYNTFYDYLRIVKNIFFISRYYENYKYI